MIKFLGLISALTLLSLSESSCSNKTTQCLCGNTQVSVSIRCNDAKQSVENPCWMFRHCNTCEDNVHHCITCPKDRKGMHCEKGNDSSLLPKSRIIPGKAKRIAKRDTSCPRLKSPVGGSIRCSYSTYSSQCTASCIPGFFFENHGGEIEVECVNGRWSPIDVLPPCKSGGACDLEVIGAGSFNCTYGMHGTWCDVRCQGRGRRYECFPGRPWRPPLPSCVRRKGIGNIEDEHCECENGGTCDPVSHRCRCPPDFRGRHCEIFQRTEYPVESPCPDPGHVTNALRLNPDGTVISPNHAFYPGSVVVYDCQNGFALMGKSLLTCTESRRWSSPPPTCSRIPSRTRTTTTTTTTTTETPDEISYCDDPGVIPNGDRVLVPWLGPRKMLEEIENEKFPQGFQIDYSCKQGYTLTGASTLICLISGIWSTGLPRCQQTSTTTDAGYCENPGRITNGKRLVVPPVNERITAEFFRDPPEFPKGTKLVFSCDDEFSIRGEDVLTCEEDEKWSNEMPRCVQQEDF